MYFMFRVCVMNDECDYVFLFLGEMEVMTIYGVCTVYGELVSCWPHENEWTYFFGTVETYGINTLSTNEPKPNLKLEVIFRIVSDSKSPNFDNLSLSSSIDFDKSIK